MSAAAPAETSTSAGGCSFLQPPSGASRSPAIRTAPTARLTQREFTAKSPGEKELERMRILGLILIILGALGIYYREIRYTKDEEILKIGPIEAKAKKQETIPIPPWAGPVGIGAGVLLFIVGGPRKR